MSTGLRVRRRLVLGACALIGMSEVLAAAATAPPLPRPRPIVQSEATEPDPVEAEAPSSERQADAAQLPRPRASGFGQVRTGTAWVEDMETHFAEERASVGQDVASREAPLYAASASAAVGRELVVPLPRPRPHGDSPVLAVLPPRVEPRAPTPLDTACLQDLRRLGVSFSEEEPIDPQGACHVDHPLKVASLGSGVAIAPAATLNCRTAEALASWVKNVLLPAAQKHLGARPERIVHASTYVCRSRNNIPGAKLSEHAHANAVDIASIAFADRDPFDIGVRDASEDEGAFQLAVRKGSCDYFTTVLGPGSDASHATHLHFDMAERNGGYRLCDMGTATAAAAPRNTNRE